MKMILTTVLLIFSSLSFSYSDRLFPLVSEIAGDGGGGHVGNGGDALICDNQMYILDEFLDNSNKANHVANSQEIISRLANKLPLLAKELKNFNHTFSSQENHVYLDNLPNLADESVELNIDCRLEQLVIRVVQYGGKPVFFVNAPLFSELNTSQKSWIMVHEFAWNLEEINPANLRKVNSILHNRKTLRSNERNIQKAILNSTGVYYLTTKEYNQIENYRKEVVNFLKTVGHDYIDTDSKEQLHLIIAKINAATKIHGSRFHNGKILISLKKLLRNNLNGSFIE